MLLAIDAGNTNVVFALVDDEGNIRTRWRIATDPRRTADEYAVWLHQLLEMEGFAKADVARVIIATVVPRALHNLTVLAEKYFHHTRSSPAGGGRSRSSSRTATVGADRALNAIAGHARHEGDLIIVDFGTATTFDVVAFSRLQGTGSSPQASTCHWTAFGRRRRPLPRIAIEAAGGQQRHPAAPPKARF